MPQPYFTQTSKSTRVEHIKAVAALKDSNMDLSMNLRSKLPDGRRTMTFIRPKNKKGLLLTLIPQLPKNENRQLSKVQLYTLADNSMCLNMFTYGTEDRMGDLEKREELMENIRQVSEGIEKEREREIGRAAE